MGKGPYRNWSVVGRHAAKLSPRYQRGARSQIRSTDGAEHTRRSGANNDDVCYLM